MKGKQQLGSTREHGLQQRRGTRAKSPNGETIEIGTHESSNYVMSCDRYVTVGWASALAVRSGRRHSVYFGFVSSVARTVPPSSPLPPLFSLLYSPPSQDHPFTMIPPMGPSVTARFSSRVALPAFRGQRCFSSARPALKEIQDAYILSASRTPTGKVSALLVGL